MMRIAVQVVLGLNMCACFGSNSMPLDAERTVIKVASTITPPDGMNPAGKIKYSTRVKEISALPPIHGGVLLLGDSITEAWMWNDFPYDGPLVNHGIGWGTSAGVIARIDQIAINQPDIIFYMIGTNDLSNGLDPIEIAASIQLSLLELLRRVPRAKIYVQSVLPRDGNFDHDVAPLNAEIESMIAKHSDFSARLYFIDLVPAFSASPEVLRPELTEDGLHLNEEGYMEWAEKLMPYLPR